jgi:hypothetical protein
MGDATYGISAVKYLEGEEANRLSLSRKDARWLWTQLTNVEGYTRGRVYKNED